MNPFTTLKNFSPFHFTSLHFTLLFPTTTHFPSLFTFYRLYFPSLVYTFLTVVLKIRVLPWEVPIAPSGSLFQSVMVLFTKEYFPICYIFFSQIVVTDPCCLVRQKSHLILSALLKNLQRLKLSVLDSKPRRSPTSP